MIFKAILTTFFFVGMTVLLSTSSAKASAGEGIEDLGQVGMLTPKPVARARSEVQVRRLRQLIAERKIDADHLIKALQALRDDQ